MLPSLALQSTMYQPTYTCCHFSSSRSLDKVKKGSLVPNMPSLFFTLIPRMVSLHRSVQDATSSPRMIMTPLLRYLHQGSRKQQQQTTEEDKPLNWTDRRMVKARYTQCENRDGAKVRDQLEKCPNCIGCRPTAIHYNDDSPEIHQN